MNNSNFRNKGEKRSNLAVQAALALLIIAMAIVLIKTAWVGDDAYITFRTVDNFFNGYGLTWNVTERVQAYTHPLWMFLLSVSYLFTHELYYTSIFLGIFLTIITVVLYARRLSSGPVMAGLGILCLMVSNSFVDYSTSGLENPLSHLLLVIFFINYLGSEKNFKSLYALSLIAGLAALNRMDTILIYSPALLYFGFSLPKKEALQAVLLGFAPFFAWEAFSLFYYGFAFPNTAYAKLNTGIARYDLVRQGMIYLRNILLWSPVTAMTILAAVIYGVHTRKLRLAIPVIGLLLYIAYLVSIGGGFMSGRFITIPFVLAVVILSQIPLKATTANTWMAFALLIMFGIGWAESPLTSGADFGRGEERKKWDHGISDERAAWYHATGMLASEQGEQTVIQKWADEGRALRSGSRIVVKRGGIGVFGFSAGPQVHIIDNYALADPLLSRLPTIDLKRWRIGHFRREIPKGYMETIESGEIKIVDPSLAAYYAKLSDIISGDLFSFSRIKEVFKINLGIYDYLLDEYLSRPQYVVYDDFSTPRKVGTPYNSEGCQIITENGLRIDLGQLCHSALIELSRDHNDSYALHFYRDSTLVAADTVAAAWIPQRGLRLDTLTLPLESLTDGYNSILILPFDGDGTYSIGHLRLL